LTALDLANAIIDEDRPIDILFPNEKELEQLPIRGTVPEKEDIRVIRVEGFDWSPCGGTHCRSTAGVRLIQVLGIRKEKDTHRLEFVCGRRAEQVARRNSTAVRDIAEMLDVGPEEVVERTQALVEKTRSLEETLGDLREARLSFDKERLLASANEGKTKTIATYLPDRTIQELRSLSHMLVEDPGMVVLLVGSDGGKIGIVFARSADREEEMSKLMKRVCADVGCRGGGNPSMATGGGGAELDPARVLEAAKKALQEGR
jgi:alanyl-tRNA synthetase